MLNPRKLAIKLISFTIFMCALASSAFASSGITYQGRILKPDGSPLSGSNVQFKIQIRSPDANNCLMYEEMQALDMHSSNGVFALTINDGTGTRTDATGLNLDRIFSNAQGTANVFNFNPATCNAGSTYAPGTSDGRSFVVYFKDETMAAYEPMPAQKINFIPLAFEAKQIAGFTPASLVRVAEADGTLGSVSPLSNANYTELLALINGTTAQYEKAGKISGVAVPSMTSGQVLGWNGSAWTSVDPASGVQTFAKTVLPTCGAGQFLKDNGSGLLVCATPAGSGGTVTQVNTGTGLTGGGFTTSGTISISAGGVGTTELAANAVTTAKLTDANVTLAKLAADSVDSSKIVDGSITGADLNAGINITTSGTVVSGVNTTRDFKLYPAGAGTNKISLAAPVALAADYTITFPLTAGGASQVLTTDGSGNLSWSTPAGTGISALTGDVTASGSGSVAATVASVGGVTAANVASGANLANAATNLNTASTIVKRDASGNFAASAVTETSTIYKDTGANTVTVQAPTTITSSYVMKWPVAVAASAGQVLSSDTSGNLSWSSLPTSMAPSGSAGGDLSGSYPNPSVATVGGSTAANVNTATIAANAATAVNTASKIVARDASGNFAANVATVNGVALNNAGSVLNITNPVGGAWNMTLPATAGTSGQVMQTNGSGVMSWMNPLTSSTAYVNGGNSFGANASFGTNDAFRLDIKTNNSTAMTVSSAGNVGIGTTAPAAKLEILSGNVDGVRITSSGNSPYLRFYAPNNAGAKNWGVATNYSGGGLEFLYSVDNTTDPTTVVAKFENTGNFLLGSQVTSPNRLNVNGAAEIGPGYWGTAAPVNGLLVQGNVGIGTSAPTTKLEVAGTVKLGDGGETCGATYAGGVRYNGGNIQFCNGTSWSTLGVAGAGITALTGDVTASGTGSVAATVAQVGGVTAANVASGANLANAATNVNTASTIVKRDASGNFAASAITSTSTVLKDTGANTVTLSAPTSVTTSYSLKLPVAVAASSGQVLASDTSGNMSWSSLPTALPPNGSAGGDLSGSYPNPTVATVGTSTAANIHSAELAANAATSANTPSTIVSRDGSGNFAANLATVNGVALNNAGSILNITNPVGGAWNMTLPATAGTSGQVMQTNGSGVMSWLTPLTSSTGFVNGGNSFGANASVGTNDAFRLDVKTNNSVAMTVDSAGKVGIGTTAPTQKVEVNGKYLTTGALGSAGDVNANQSGFYSYRTAGRYLDLRTDGGWNDLESVGSPLALNTTSNQNIIAFGHALSSNAQFLIGINSLSAARLATKGKTADSTAAAFEASNSGDASLLFVRNDGNVGIGTAAPATKLQVTGTVVLGDGGETCGASYAGGVRYNGGNIQFCNGTSWSTLGVAGAGITALTGDVTASGSGSVAATVAQVGGVTAANVATGANAANAAASLNTFSTIVKRDGAGGFAAGTITSTSNVLKDTGSNTVTLSAPNAVSTSYALRLPTAVAGTAGQVLASDTSGNMSWSSLPTALPPNGSAGGDLSGSYPNPTVATVGTSTAAQIHSAELAANAATAANTASAIVSRDGTGNFAANVATVNGLALKNAGSILNITNPVGGAWNMTLPATAGTSGQVMQTNGSGIMTWTTPLTSSTGFINGGNTFGANASIGTNDAFRLDVKTNNAVAMTVDSAGKVGIGTTSPSNLLHIKASGSTVAMVESSTAGQNAAIGFSNPTRSWTEGLRPGAGVTDGYFAIVDDSAAGAARLVINTTGQVGIGTTAPGANLHVAAAGAPSNIVVERTGANAAILQLGAINDSGVVMTVSNDPLLLGANNAESMRIIPSGSVGIGTTAPATKLEVSGGAGNGKFNLDTAINANFTIESDPTNGYYPTQTFRGMGVTVGSFQGYKTNYAMMYRFNEHWFANTAGTVDYMRIVNGGNVGIGTTAPATKLEVAGSIRVGDGGETCGAAFTGAIRYNGGGMQFCNGTAWTTLGVAGSGISALTGDVTASGNGSVAATVASVGTSSAANIHSAELAANAATAVNTANKIVSRDGSGNFAAGVGTFNGVALNNAGSVLNIYNPIGGAWNLTLPTTAGTSGQVMQTNGSGVMSWITAATATTAFMKGGNSFSSNASIGTNDAYRLDVKTNNAVAMTVDTAGKVGIGTTAPAVALHVMGPIRGDNGASDVIIQNGDGNVAFRGVRTGAFNDSSQSQWFQIGTSGDSVVMSGNVGSQIPRFGINAAATLISANGDFYGGHSPGAPTPSGIFAIANSASTQVFNVLNSGNVGIGTTAPAVTLDVAANTTLPVVQLTQNAAWNSGTGNYALSVTGYTNLSGFRVNGADKTNSIYQNSGSMGFTVNDGSAITFNHYAAGGERMRIDAGGNVGIGTTSPTDKLQVAGNIRSSGQISSASQSITGGTSTINWDAGNNVLTDYDCSSNLVMNNMRDGGTYTLVVTNAGTTQCNFSTSAIGTDAATVAYKFKPANGPREASTYTVYTLMRIGTTVLVSWSSGFQ